MTEEPTTSRRRLLKTVGASTAGLAAASGVVSAHKWGISWIAFCGCTNVRIDCVEMDDGEVTRVEYDAQNADGDCCRVFYKTGPWIFEDWPPGDRNDVASTYDLASDPPDCPDEFDCLEDSEDPPAENPVDCVASKQSSHSRDPCGIIAGATGTKYEAAQLRRFPTEGCATGHDVDGALGPPPGAGGPAGGHGSPGGKARYRPKGDDDQSGDDGEGPPEGNGPPERGGPPGRGGSS